MFDGRISRETQYNAADCAVQQLITQLLKKKEPVTETVEMQLPIKRGPVTQQKYTEVLRQAVTIKEDESAKTLREYAA